MVKSTPSSPDAAETARFDLPVELSEATAVIGMSGRFPDAPSVDEYWRNLQEGIESVRALSDDELRQSGVDPGLLAHPNYVKAASILEDVEMFEPGFFGLSPREAQVLDPQIRLFLECCWEAFETAGYDPGSIDGRTGVYAGMRLSDYLLHNVYSNPELLETIGDFQAVLGNDKDYLTTFVSYKLDLTGPSLAVQSACSTSLVAVHLACEALAAQECDLALAGGATIRLPQRSGYFFHPEGIFSPDGHCRPFDAAANGTVFGNGVGVVLLKRLQDAFDDGDPVLAVIRGSAVNNDGARKVGFTAPAVSGQAGAVADALAMAGLDPADIGFVECHGTGTALGDPIEITALDRVFQNRGGACGLGSVKGNLGHLEAAAGIASLIKTVQMVRHGRWVPSLHFRQANPRLRLESTPFEVNTGSRPWPEEAPRRAGVSSFGIGGTNTHVVVEPPPPRAASGPSRRHQILVLSARTPSALAAATRRLGEALAASGAPPLADAAYTLATGRRAFPHRRAVVCRPEEAADELLAGADSPAVRDGVAGEAPGVVFLFPGQGAQFPGMGSDLYHQEPTYREIIDRGAETLQPRVDLDLRRLLLATPDDAEAAAELRQTRLAQPALFLVEYALARLWAEWGVRPAAMVGHSIGEYTAACLAGVFTFDDALRLVAERGRLMQHMPRGSMLALHLAADEVRRRLEQGAGQQLDLAAVNAPRLCVVSGPDEAVEAFAAECAADGVEHRRLHTSHAFHSRAMEPILDVFAEHLRRCELSPPEAPWVSNVTGTWIDPIDAVDPDYWARHLRRPVLFAAGLETAREGRPVLLEVGPGRTLVTLARRGAAAEGTAATVASLRHPDDAQEDGAVLLRALGSLWTAGVEVDWEGFNRHQDRRRVALPTYPFERQRCWIEPLPGDARRRPAGKRPDVGEWLYLASWRRTATPPVTAPQHGLRWWLLSDGSALADDFGIELRAAGQEVVQVLPGDGFEDRGAGSYAMVRGRSSSFTTLLERTGPPDRVVSFRGTDEAEGSEGAATLLAVACALEAASVALDLAAVAQGWHEIAGEGAPDPRHAGHLGACRSIAAQVDGAACRVLDLAPATATPGPAGAERLLAELARDGEPGLEIAAWRGGHRWSPAFEPAATSADGAIAWAEGGLYLLAGELEGPAMDWASALRERHGAHFVIIPSGSVPDDLSPSSRVVDSHSREAVAAAVAEAVELHGQVRGVVASLGFAGPRSGVESADVADWQRRADSLERDLLVLEEAMRYAPGPAQEDRSEEAPEGAVPNGYASPPLAGPATPFRWFLTPAESLWDGCDRFVGAASTAFADASVAAWRSGGLPWVSVRCAGWAGGEPRHRATPAETVEVLARLAARPAMSHVLMSPLDLEMQFVLAARAAAAGDATGEAPAGDGVVDDDAPRPGIATPYVAPRDDLERGLAAIWREQLGVDRVGRRDDFFELGGHSLVATRVLSRVRERMEVALDLRTLFERPTVAGMAEAITAARETGECATALPAVEPVPRTGDLPLASPQERLWFLDRLQPDSPTYNLSAAFDVPPGLEVGLFVRTLSHLVRRHEILRTSFPTRDGQAVQRIYPPRPFRLPVVDLSALGDDLRERRAAHEARREAERPFDLARGPLFRGVLLRLADGGQRLLLSLHHIIADGWSFNVLQLEVREIYEALAEGRAPDLPPLPVQYADYAVWQRRRLDSDEMDRLLDHWRRRLAGAPTLLELPLDAPRGEAQEPWGARQPVSLDPTVRDSLVALAREEGASLFMVLLAVFEVLIGLECDQQDFLVGTDVANRPRQELEPLIGLFVNQVVLRAVLLGDPSFRELLGRVRETALDAFAHQELPLERLIKELAPQRDRSHNPLFQVLFLLQNFPPVDDGGDPAEGRVMARFDLKAELREQNGEVGGWFEYRSDLFRPSTVQRMTSRYERLAALAAAEPDRPIADLLDALARDERKARRKARKGLKKAGLAILRRGDKG